MLNQQGATISGWWRQRPVWVMLLLGFSAGLPILLIFSSLSLWLREAGVSRSTVTFFSWAALGYSFKFVWAPLVDKLPLPLLSALLGRRRAWLFAAQCMVIASICLMASTDPLNNLTIMALAAVLLGFSSATQDIVIDAFRIESADREFQALLSATYITGYRVGMIVAGAGALYLAEWFGSSTEVYRYEAWQNTYYCMAAFMLVGIVTTLVVSEPQAVKDNAYPYSAQQYLRFVLLFLLSLLAFVSVFLLMPSAPELFTGYAQVVFRFIYACLSLGLAVAVVYIVVKALLNINLASEELVLESYWSPIRDFFHRYGKVAIWVLLLVGFYRVSDIVMGVIANVFYQDMGYTKSEIASVTKVFGVLMTIVGGFVGGVMALKFGVVRLLLAGAVLVVVTNLLFMWLAGIEPDVWALSLVIASDNLSAGIASAAFVAWLSSLTSLSFTATQYALFSSLMTLFPKLLAGYSGTVVEQLDYAPFFFLASCLGLPVIALILVVQKKLSMTSTS